MESSYVNNVFINCPFDGEYLPIFRAVIFTIFDCFRSHQSCQGMAKQYI
jgi:hypothetical protein